MSGDPDDSTPEHAGPESTIVLLRRARTGDHEARDRLFRRLTPIVLRWAHGRLPVWARYRCDSDDLVQDALMATVKSLHRIDAGGSAEFYAYLHKTLQNRILDEISRAKHRPRASGEPEEALAPSPLETLLDAEALERYQRALASVTPEDQAAILVRIELGMSLEETAAELGKPSADAARMAVSRAVKRLVEAMQRER
jgi:RNA polymerase sigma factor (sigma-70 family)